MFKEFRIIKNENDFFDLINKIKIPLVFINTDPASIKELELIKLYKNKLNFILTNSSNIKFIFEPIGVVPTIVITKDGRVKGCRYLLTRDILEDIVNEYCKGVKDEQCINIW